MEIHKQTALTSFLLFALDFTFLTQTILKWTNVCFLDILAPPITNFRQETKELTEQKLYRTIGILHPGEEDRNATAIIGSRQTRVMKHQL